MSFSIQQVQLNTDAVCEREAVEILGNSRWAVFVARLNAGAETSPVGYLEGLYICADYRRQGIGAALVGAGEQWAWSRGCSEIASDAEIGNAASIEMHQRMGYREVERQVCFLKRRE